VSAVSEVPLPARTAAQASLIGPAKSGIETKVSIARTLLRHSTAARPMEIKSDYNYGGKHDTKEQHRKMRW
jgi:hypothetical protein